MNDVRRIFFGDWTPQSAFEHRGTDRHIRDNTAVEYDHCQKYVGPSNNRISIWIQLQIISKYKKSTEEHRNVQSQYTAVGSQRRLDVKVACENLGGTPSGSYQDVAVLAEH